MNIFDAHSTIPNRAARRQAERAHREINIEAMRRFRAHQKVLSVLNRSRAALALMHLAKQVQNGPFRIEFVPTRLGDEEFRQGKRRRRVISFARLSRQAAKDVEVLLKGAYPQLNRAERRQMARNHGWMLLSQAEPRQA